MASPKPQRSEPSCVGIPKDFPDMLSVFPYPEFKVDNTIPRTPAALAQNLKDSHIPTLDKLLIFRKHFSDSRFLVNSIDMVFCFHNGEKIIFNPFVDTTQYQEFSRIIVVPGFLIFVEKTPLELNPDALKVDGTQYVCTSESSAIGWAIPTDERSKISAHCSRVFYINIKVPGKIPPRREIQFGYEDEERVAWDNMRIIHNGDGRCTSTS